MPLWQMPGPHCGSGQIGAQARHRACRCRLRSGPEVLSALVPARALTELWDMQRGERGVGRRRRVHPHIETAVLMRQPQLAQAPRKATPPIAPFASRKIWLTSRRALPSGTLNSIRCPSPAHTYPSDGARPNCVRGALPKPQESSCSRGSRDVIFASQCADLEL
jgi:hypothetical protein